MTTTKMVLIRNQSGMNYMYYYYDDDDDDEDDDDDDDATGDYHQNE